MHNRLAQALDAAGMSPDMLARRAGTSVYHIGEYLDGARIPTAPVALRIAAALHVSPSWLVVGEPKTIGDRIRSLRYELGRSTGAFGDALGVTRSVVSGWETGSPPSLMSAVTLAETYGVSLDWLLLGKGEMQG